MNAFVQLSELVKALPKNSIVLFRHGQTEANLTKQLAGWTNSQLTQKGREQAQKLSQALVPNLHIFDQIYSSDLSRAFETAQLSLGLNTPILKDSRLREMHFGDLENQYYEQLFGQSWKDIILSMTYRAPNGEALNNVKQRALSLIQNVKHPARYLIYTHGGVIFTFTQQFGIKTLIPNSSCVAFELDKCSLKSVLFQWEFPE